jgi:dTDP-4-dehydrorhamnose reductase
MRVLLLGAGGMLARALRAHAHECTVVCRTHRELDIQDRDALARALDDARPDWVINASAFTDVDGAEDDAEAAFAVNARAVGALARACRDRRCGVVHFSTDYVFDGSKAGFYSETDAPNPLNVYGASKLAGERELQESGARFLLIRTQWLFGEGGRSFVGSLWDRAIREQPTTATDDQYGGCTYSTDLATVVWQSIGRLEGLFHAANRGRVSRYMIAERVFARCGVPGLVTRGSFRDFPQRARRPVSSSLDVTKLEDALQCRMAEWSDAIDRYVLAKKANDAVGA